MSLPILIEEIYFGERDALHEFMKQDKVDLQILESSFVPPPRIKLDELYSGARYIIVGPKGSGKTTLLWHMKRRNIPNKSKVILFKSQLRKEDRDQLDKMVDMVIVQDQKSYSQEADYKTVWEWYILKNVFRLIDPTDLLAGAELYHDIVLLLEADKNKFNTLYDKFHVGSVKGKVKINLDLGVLKSEIATEISARRTDDSRIELLDLVRLVQGSLSSLKFKANTSIRLYFDELEFFISTDGDGQRDRRMVRDLLFSVYNTNLLFSTAGLDVVTFASIRSEIVSSVQITTQELSKIISAFGVNLNWHNENTENHPILQIFENKIHGSEINQVGRYSEDVWSTYFPATIFDKEIKKYLLDSGLHRPRGVLLRLAAAAELAYGKRAFSAGDFINSEENFGEVILEEFTDEISATCDEAQKEAITALLRGYPYSFNREEFLRRISTIGERDAKLKKFFQEMGVDNLLRLLFRIGLIGNQFELSQGGAVRQAWAFRGNADPLLDKRFVVHSSVRKVLATMTCPT